MDNNAKKDIWIDEVLNSTQGISRAQPGANLYRDINMRLLAPETGKTVPVPVKQWAAAAILLLALNVGSVAWFTSRSKKVVTATVEDPLAMQIQSVTTYNY